MKKIILLFAFCGLLINAKSQSVVAVPYHEDFETSQGAANWSTFNLNSDDGDWFYADIATYGGIGYQQSACYAYIYSSANAGNDWFVSPGLTLTGGVNYNVSFMYAAFDSTKTEKLEVYIGNDATAAASTTILVNYDSLTCQTFKTFNYSFTPSSSGNYYVKFYAYSDVNEGAILIDEFNISAASSINEAENNINNIKVFPNPATENVIIDNSNYAVVTITDIAGKTVYSNNNAKNNLVINVKDFGKGMYFLHFEKNGHINTKKLIVN